MATSWDEPRGILGRLFRKMSSKLSENPDYGSKLHLVHRWFVEFDDDGHPYREIGVDNAGNPVLAGPDKRNYGFWLDTNATFKDFDGEAISGELFEIEWRRFYERHPGREDPSFRPDPAFPQATTRPSN